MICQQTGHLGDQQEEVSNKPLSLVWNNLAISCNSVCVKWEKNENKRTKMIVQKQHKDL